MSRNKTQISDFKRFKTINELSSVALLSILTGAFLFVAYLFTSYYQRERDPITGEWVTYLYYYPDYLWGGVAGVLVGLGCDIAGGILIMAGRFQSKWASKISNKLIFGLIGLLVVGPVMYYIFAGIGKRKARKEEQEQRDALPINDQYNNPFNRPQQPSGYSNSNPFSQNNNNVNPFSQTNPNDYNGQN